MPFGGDDGERVPSHHLAVVLLPEGADREAVRAALDERGIQTSVHYPPIHTFSAYRVRVARAASADRRGRGAPSDAAALRRA